MDRQSGIVHYDGMRVVIALGFLVLLAACSGDPASYGITGPGTQAAPTAPVPSDGETSNPIPGVPTSGNYYGSSNGPIKSSSGFFGYN